VAPALDGSPIALPPDTRPLAEIEFAIDVQDPAAREMAAGNVRAILRRCGVAHAQDIVDLGCTGLFSKLCGSAPDPAFAVVAADSLVLVQRVRANMGGSLVGLPCYVPPDRFCLIHNTIGGLSVEKGQASRYPEVIPQVSRDLSPQERGHVSLIEAARNTDATTRAGQLREAKDTLAGKQLPKGWTMESDAPQSDMQPPGPATAAAANLDVTTGAAAEERVVGFCKALSYAIGYDAGVVAIDHIVADFDLPLPLAEGIARLARIAVAAVQEQDMGFICREHVDAPAWHCRFCIAQMVANMPGGYKPALLMAPATEGTTAILEDAGEIDPADVDTVIEKYSFPGAADTAALYVKCARWHREPTKLVRDK
jgi:hypothetical protein